MGTTARGCTVRPAKRDDQIGSGGAAPGMRARAVSRAESGARRSPAAAQAKPGRRSWTPLLLVGARSVHHVPQLFARQ
eukprot:5617502-Prymnesium_polylepis.1